MSATDRPMDVPSPRQKDRVLWFSGPAVIVFTTAVLLGALALYRDRMATIPLAEQRFLTTEWRLLEELKTRTDRELLQKDQQIADLNRLYLELVQTNASPDRRQQVKDQIDQAEAERSSILARSISAVVARPPESDGSPSAPLPAGGEPAVASLLANQVEMLQAQLRSRSALVDTLDREREALISSHEEAAQAYLAALRKDEARIAALSADLERMHAGVDAAAAAIARGADTAGPERKLDLQDVRTQTLVRALVDSPEIRAAYPGLLKSLDHFLDAYGREQREAGKREAFTSMGTVLGPLSSETNGP